MSIPDMQDKRVQWKESIKSELLEHLVFLNESRVNTNLPWLYGRNLSSKRVVDHAPLNTSKHPNQRPSFRRYLLRERKRSRRGYRWWAFSFVFEKKHWFPPWERGYCRYGHMRSHRAKVVGEFLLQNSIITLYLHLIILIWTQLEFVVYNRSKGSE